jgi:UDP-GlcNAc:undecaprenyl-phosphate/decaprenyl-phosphate GlcNAc-1-phosphate transferase
MPVIHGMTFAQMALGFAIAMVASLACIRWVAPMGWTDHPDPRKHHHKPTPRTAGLALWLLLTGLLALGQIPLPLDRVEWTAVHVMALIGFIDDRFDLRSRHKAIVGLVVAGLLAMHTAPELGQLTKDVHFLGLILPNHLILTVPLLALWFWSVPQAFNLIDGVNGLSMGYSLLLLLVIHAVLGHAPAGGFLAGGLLGVLLLNYPRARHFLGDCGSLMLGTLFAILTAKIFAVPDANLMLWVLAYPAVDVALVISVRKWKGMPLGSADRSHLHHYLLDHLGPGKAWLVPLILLGLALLPMTRALVFPGHKLFSLLGLAGLFYLAMKAFRDRVDPERVVMPLKPRQELLDASGSDPVA